MSRCVAGLRSALADDDDAGRPDCAAAGWASKKSAVAHAAVMAMSWSNRFISISLVKLSGLWRRHPGARPFAGCGYPLQYRLERAERVPGLERRGLGRGDLE